MAITKGFDLMSEIDRYGFECEAGYLENAVPWQGLLKWVESAQRLIGLYGVLVVHHKEGDGGTDILETTAEQIAELRRKVDPREE